MKSIEYTALEGGKDPKIAAEDGGGGKLDDSDNSGEVTAGGVVGYGDSVTSQLRVSED